MAGLSNEWNRTKELIRRLIQAWTTAQNESETAEARLVALENVELIVEEMKKINDQYFGDGLPSNLGPVTSEDVMQTTTEVRDKIRGLVGGYRYKTPKNRRKTKTKSKTKSKSPTKSKKSKKSRRKSKY